MSVIAYIDCAKLVDDAGFPGGTSQAQALAIIAAESGRRPDAKYVNTDGSIDRGLWQLNSKWHAEVTDAQAYDPVAATAAAFRISKSGTDFTPWATFTNGAYEAHLEAARVALDGWARAKALQAKLAGVTSDLTAADATIDDLNGQLALLRDKVDAANAKADDLAAQLATATAARDKLAAVITSALDDLQAA